MNILIIEDELPARQRLVKLINKYFPDFNICAELDSCVSAIEYLRKNTPDLIFMDVELSDGKCFEIFENIEISAHLQSSVFKLSKDLIDSIHVEGMVAYTS